MDLSSALEAAISNVLFVGAILASFGIGLAVEIGVLVSSVRGSRKLEALRSLALQGDFASLAAVKVPSVWQVLLAALAPLVLAACGAVSIQAARGLILHERV